MKSYLIKLLSIVIIILIVIASFNWVINPFDFLNSPTFEGINKYKPKIRARMTKVYKTNQIKPATIILGSSRTLNMPSVHQSFINTPIYNLSLASGSGYEMFRMFQHAQANSPLKTVVVGLDESFKNSTYTNFNDDRFLVTKDGDANIKRFVQYWRDIYNSLLSIDAIRASVSTIKKQSNFPIDKDSPLTMAHRVFNAGGHHHMFSANENQYLEKLNTINSCGLNNALPNELSIKSDLDGLKYFKTMLEIAYRDNIQLYLFFSPIHARLQEVNCILDAGTGIEAYKYSVVYLVESLAKKYKKNPFIILDFGGYNRITTEPVPKLNDKKTLMQWYWEGSHYTNTTASLMLDKLFKTKNDIDKDNFGFQLRSNNIIEYFKRQRVLGEQYRSQHKDDIVEIRQRAIKNLK